VFARLLSERVRQLGESAGDRRRGRTDVEPEVERDLVVSRATRVKAAAELRLELGEPPLHRGVDVFVALRELELARLQLATDAGQRLLHPLELRLGEESGGPEPDGVAYRPGDVEGRQAEVDLKRI
jgi:hypothetical protein